MERTRARVGQERATAADRRWDEMMLAALALFAWTVGLTVWFVFRIFTGGALVILGANLVRFGNLLGYLYCSCLADCGGSGSGIGKTPP